MEYGVWSMEYGVWSMEYWSMPHWRWRRSPGVWSMAGQRPAGGHGVWSIQSMQTRYTPCRAVQYAGHESHDVCPLACAGVALDMPTFRPEREDSSPAASGSPRSPNPSGWGVRLRSSLTSVCSRQDHARYPPGARTRPGLLGYLLALDKRTTCSCTPSCCTFCCILPSLERSDPVEM